MVMQTLLRMLMSTIRLDYVYASVFIFRLGGISAIG